MKISETVKKRVYTDNGEYFGDIEEANIENNKIAGWRIKISGQIGSVLGGVRGVIIPHNFVKAIGDIMIISKASLPEDSLNKSEGKTESLM
ncbi:MAG: PRC-barrel domain-containing protein [Candidatus Pacearchaeota archaeon]